MRTFDFRDGLRRRTLMRMTSLLRASVIAALVLGVGCSGAHLQSLSDAGAEGPDAAPVVRSCHLGSPPPAPAFAGEGCYCDGPFAVRGGVAYRQSYMLEVIDVSTAGAPHLVTSLPSHAFYASDVGIVGDVLVSAGGALELFDLRAPLAPVSLGTVDVGGEVHAMAVSNGRIVVSITRADQSNALVVLDASDPRAVRVGAALELGALGVGSLAMRGTVAFGAAMDLTGTTPSRVVAIETADVSTPRMLGSLVAPVTYLATVGLHDTRLFVSGLETGVRVVDVADPAAMRDLGVAIEGVPGAMAVAVTNDVLVVAGQGLSLYDLSTPTLTPMGRTEPTADSPHAMIVGNQLLGSGGNALFSIPLACD